MDKTVLNLCAILITGTGVIGSLIAYEPPELNATYWGFNPFAYKKSEIDKALRRAFASLALFGLAVQAYPFFFWFARPETHNGFLRVVLCSWRRSYDGYWFRIEKTLYGSGAKIVVFKTEKSNERDV